MRIAICDDEEVFLEHLYKDLLLLSNELKIECSILKYKSGSELLEYFQVNRNFDVIFMDILLGKENGYNIAKNIRSIDSKVKIVFLTSITKYALKGYEINAARYLVKPITIFQLKSILPKMIIEIEADNGYYIEQNDDGIYKIYFSDIKYIETYGRNTLVHIKDYDVLSYKSMKMHMSNLNNQFIRCHAAIIVNLKYVAQMGKTDLILTTGESIPLSKNRKREFKEAFLNYYGDLL